MRLPVRAIVCAAVLALPLAAPAAAQQRVEYDVAFPNADHHEARIRVTFAGAPLDRPLEVRMSRSSPGRYALHEFAKNVYAVEATDGAGRPLRITRPDPHQWNVHGHDGVVHLSYTLFADRADGTYSGIDNTHAHLNMPATFVWARGMETAEVRIRFQRPPGWRVATQLVPTADSAVFTAPDLQYFLDSPTEVSPFTLREWPLDAGGMRQTIRLAVHHAGTEGDVDAFAKQARRIVLEQVAVFGAPPRFDHGTYTFIADYLPHVHGDGMEHRNSTILTSTLPIAGNEQRLLRTLSHEFFHAWNVERIRPASLEPFDFERANMSGDLWFGEGFTNYYDRLTMRRAGIHTDAEYAALIGDQVATVTASPGRRYHSPVEMSYQAPFVDAAASIDPTNRHNTFISYYTWGAALALGLDLALRDRFPGVTLDDYMRAVWRRHGDGRPYTGADLREVLAEVTGDAAFAAAYFDRYVEGRELMDYPALLARAGFLVRPAAPGRVWLGAGVEAADAGVRLTTYALEGSSLRGAGLSIGDLVVAVDDAPVATPAELTAALAARGPGETAVIEYRKRGEGRVVPVRLVEFPLVEVVPYEAAGLTPTRAMLAFRRAWLGSRAEGGR